MTYYMVSTRYKNRITWDKYSSDRVGQVYDILSRSYIPDGDNYFVVAF